MSHLFLEVLGGGFTDQWSHHYLFNISSGAVYYIFILSWGFLRGGYHPPLFSSVLVMDHQVCHHSDHEYLRVNLFYDLKSWYSFLS